MPNIIRFFIFSALCFGLNTAVSEISADENSEAVKNAFQELPSKIRSSKGKVDLKELTKTVAPAIKSQSEAARKAVAKKKKDATKQYKANLKKKKKNGKNEKTPVTKPVEETPIIDPSSIPKEVSFD